MKFERNTLIKHINNLPLERQFALMAVKLQMFGGKTRHGTLQKKIFFCLVSSFRCNKREWQNKHHDNFLTVNRLESKIETTNRLEEPFSIVFIKLARAKAVVSPGSRGKSSYSLRSKRFRLVSEQKNPRGTGFSVFRAVFDYCSSFFTPKPHHATILARDAW